MQLSIWHYIRRCWGKNLVLLMWVIIGALCITGNGLASANVLTALVARQIHVAVMWGVALLVINLLWSYAIGAKTISYAKAEQAMSTALRTDIVRGVTQRGYAAFHEQDMRTYVSWLTNDVTTIQDLGFDMLEFVIGQVLTVIFSISVLATFHYSLIITILVLVVVMMGTARAFGNRLNDASVALTHGNERLTRTVTDILSGFDTLFMLGRLSLVQVATNRASADVAQRKVHYARVDGHLMSVTNGVSLISQVIVLLQAAILYALHLTPVGAISAATYFAGNIFANLSGISANIMEMRAVKPVFAKFPVASAATVRSNVTANQLPGGDLVLENVTFAYQDAKTPTISDFSTVFAAGKKYALVGESGVGKTTLLRMLAGMTALTEGNIRIGVVNYAEIDGSTLRTHVAYVEQTPFIFNDTLRANLTLGDDFTDDELACVAQQTGLDAVIEGLPDGLSTVLDAQGTNLSGGQRARVAIARNLLRGKDILLLDEPTAALDHDSAQALMAMLMGLADVTVIVVTHHLDDQVRLRLDGVVTISK